jgi:hypothetical protein
VLIGLTLNADFGLWWADPALALVIAALAIKEGHRAWQGEGYCSHNAHAHAAQRQNSVRLEPRAGLSGHGVAGGTQEKGPCPRSKHNGPHGRSFILSSPED